MDALALVIAAALLVVGAAAVAVRQRSLGTAAVIVGLCLPVMTQATEMGASAYAVPIASATAPLLAPVVAAAVARASTTVAVALVAGIVAGPVRTLAYNAYFDPTCSLRCSNNPIAVAHLSAHAHDMLWLAAAVAAAALTVAAVRGRERAALAALAVAAWLLTVDRDQPLLPSMLIGLVALVVTGLAVVHAIEIRARTTEMTRALELAGDVESALASAARDPRLVVTYLLDDGSEVRPDGSPATAADGSAVIDLVGPDGVVARVHHGSADIDTTRLAQAVHGAGRLALENGRLAVEVRHKADALEASRRRLVEQADSERRRLERDLHDSAQQHVLALGLALRGALEDASDAGTRDVLHRSLASTYEVLDELRELSHGFYPASLEQTGLGNALDGVVDRAPVPVTVLAVPEGRLPARAERAVYLLVARAALSARRPVTVAVERRPDRIEVRITGAPPPDDVLGDVFAVLGGNVEVVAGAGGRQIRATLPPELPEEDS